MIKYGITSTPKNKVIGNKSTMLISSNGKWKLKTEKSTIFKDKKKEKSMRKKIKQDKNNNNYKSILDKSNFAIS